MYDATAIKELPQTDTNIKHHFSDSVYAKQMELPKGHVAVSHKHSYSHLSVLAKGECIVSQIVDGVETSSTHTAPDALEIKAGVEHQIEAVTDVSWFCIHSTEEKDPKKIDEVAIGSIREA